MEDFYFAGGLRALLAELPDLLHGDSMTVNGATPAARRRARPATINPNAVFGASIWRASATMSGWLESNSCVAGEM